jgi:hypothetical protein
MLQRLQRAGGLSVHRAGGPGPARRQRRRQGDQGSRGWRWRRPMPKQQPLLPPGPPPGPKRGGGRYARPFHPWLSISAEIYLCHTCSCHEILRMETPGQVPVRWGGGGAYARAKLANLFWARELPRRHAAAVRPTPACLPAGLPTCARAISPPPPASWPAALQPEPAPVTAAAVH